MSLSHSPAIVRSGLVLHLDAANPKSYPGTGTVWTDLSGRGNDHTIINSVVHASGEFTINETNYFNRAAAITGTTAANTVVMWYKTTDTQELWVRGAGYLSASSGQNYYHSAVGSPVNYIDTVVQVNPTSFRNGQYHMWEAKNVDFTGWTFYNWFGYGAAWNMNGTVACITVYDRVLSANESAQNYEAYRGRYGI